MHGFVATISLNKNLPSIEFLWKPLFSFQPPHVKRQFTSPSVKVEQYTSEKFITDKLWIDNDDFFIVTDGLILNIDSLCKEYQVDGYEPLIRILVSKDRDFFKQFTGNFVGFFWGKKNNTYTAFNNHTATKKLFYFYNHEFLLYSTDLYTLGKTLEQLEIKKTLDVEAAYLLLTSGFMHDDYTLIKEVKQIRAGEYALHNQQTLSLIFYFHLKDIQENSDSKDTIIEKLDILFKKAIITEFEFEKTRQYEPLTTLSGGLDSRMVALMAHDLNYRNQVMFNFSEKGYADDIIAKQIAEAYAMKITQIPLTPKGLLAIEDVVAVNDGLNIYSGVSHAFEAFKQLDYNNIGMIHTGILGDGFMGSYLNSKIANKAFVSDGGYSSGLINKATEIIEKSILKSENEELYKFYNRAFMGINTGFLIFDLVGETLSTFTHPPFINYALSIPRKKRYKNKLYIQWMKKKHPEYTHFIWEGIGGKPTNNKLLIVYYRLKRALIKRLPIATMWKNNMNPEQLWYDNDPVVKQTLDDYFKANIHQFNKETELMNDMTHLYYTGDITEKTQVLTLLAAYKLHFAS